jgi:nucleoside-diphosphate-sugar epimerase
MKILLTGSSGFLGKYLQNALKFHSLRVLNRSKSDFNYDLASEVPIINEKFELVIHNAGYAHIVPQTKNDIQLFYDINVSGTINLLNSFSKGILPQKFVFISSVSVYGLKKGLNINEDYPLLANDPYGKSKIEAEKFVLNWCKECNIICTILRLPLIAGSNPPGNLGSMIDVIKKGYYFNIGKGKAKKSMVFAEDVANSILKVAEVGGIYNLTDGYHPSFAELSNHIFIQLGKGKPMNIPLWLARIIAYIGDSLGSKAPLNTNKFDKITSNLTFDDSKAREAFGWKPTPVLEGFKLNTNVQ